MTCAKTEICLFDEPKPQIVIDTACFQEVFPSNDITGSSDIEFNIIGSINEYLDMNDTLLYVRLTVMNGSTKINDIPDLSASNFFLFTLFIDAILTLNNRRIEGGDGTYCFKAILESFLNYSSDTLKTNLANLGYGTIEERKKLIAGGKVVELCGPVQLDFFDQPKYLLPNVNVHLRLKRNNVNFCLNSGVKDPGTFNIKIEEAHLYVRRVKVEPSVLIGHQIGLRSRNAMYPIRKTKISTFNVAIGSQNFYKDQIFGDYRVPKFVLVAFQTQKQNTGSLDTDSTTFEHFNATSVTLSRDTDFRETYTQDFEKDYYVRTYTQSIIRNLGQLEKNMNLGMSFKDFKEKYPFFTFVLAPDFDQNQVQVPKQGNLRLEIQFAKPLPAGCSIIVYGIFDATIQINNQYSVIL